MNADRCPGCGRPFATEITHGNQMVVICQQGHSFPVASVERGQVKTTYTLRDEKEQTLWK